MKPLHITALVAALSYAAPFALELPSLRAQDATTIPRPNIGWSPGAVCADGYALTFVGGQLMCVNSVENAQNAATAASATTAATAQQLDPNATVSATQISGQISSQQLQTPTCGSGQVLTNTGNGMECIAGGGSGGPAQPQCKSGTVSASIWDGYNPYYPQYGGVSRTLGTGVIGQVQEFFGIVYHSEDYCTNCWSNNWSVTYTCQEQGWTKTGGDAFTPSVIPN